MHCLFGEDETFEQCEKTFPKEATIKCEENRAYDITIKAIPCNGGIPECRDGSDEDCEDDITTLVIVFVFLVLITFCIYFYLKWKIIIEWAENYSMSNASLNGELSVNGSCVTHLGDDLANLKVRLFEYNINIKKLLHFLK